MLIYNRVSAHTADVRFTIQHKLEIKADSCSLTQSNDPLNWQPRTSDFFGAFVHSPQTRVRFYSSQDTTGFLTVVETPWRNCSVSQELFSRMKSWGEPVSFVLLAASRRLKYAKCHQVTVGRGGATLSFRWVASSAEQAALSPAHCGDSARDHPQLVASLTLWQQLPCRSQWHSSSMTDITNLPLTGCLC